MRAPRPLIILGASWLLAAPMAWGQSVVTQREALALAAPGATWERRTAYLSEDDLERIAARAAPAAVEHPVVTYYVACEEGVPTRVAYFDAHPVRTLPEVLMVVVNAGGWVERVTVLKFMEPPEYQAPDGWLRQFDGRALEDDVSLKGGIVGITGATLTAEAATAAVRRVLALHAHLAPVSGEGP